MNATEAKKPPVEFPKTHLGDKLINQMMINLTANNRDPDAVERKISERDIARAADATTPESGK